MGSKEVNETIWLKVVSPKSSEILPSFLLGLDKGERDVIILAKEINADLVIIDEKAGRKVAKASGLKVKGTLGILLMAYRKNIINKIEAEEAIKKLEKSFLRISPNLISWFYKELNKVCTNPKNSLENGETSIRQN